MGIKICFENCEELHISSDLITTMHFTGGTQNLLYMGTKNCSLKHMDVDRVMLVLNNYLQNRDLYERLCRGNDIVAIEFEGTLYYVQWDSNNDFDDEVGLYINWYQCNEIFNDMLRITISPENIKYRPSQKEVSKKSDMPSEDYIKGIKEACMQVEENIGAIYDMIYDLENNVEI